MRTTLWKVAVWILQRLDYEGAYIMVQRRGRPTQFLMYGRVMQDYTSNEQSKVL